MGQPNLKHRVARTLKWNIIDKVSTQVLYAVTGIVLARVLSHEAFGLLGAITAVQAFANLFVDSGFSYALLQRKHPTDTDYSTVLWFNLLTATVIYTALWFATPWIATIFQNDLRIIPLARVMFVTFIINALGIVQINRRVKLMDMRPVTIANSLGIVVGAAVGISLALLGYGPWALVWQSIALCVTKTIALWTSDSWRPTLTMQWSVLRSFFSVGCGAMGTSFLNTLFQNIYTFFIGARAGVVPLGYFHQADKWSKMGISSISATLTQTFLPILSQYQDDPERFSHTTSQINRLTSYVLFPAIALLISLAPAIFHMLFGTKWDGSIPLFQLLLARGIFIVLNAVYHNYVLSLGRSKLMVVGEIVRDGVALLGIFVTLPYIALSTPASITQGICIFLFGQLAAGLLSWIAMIWMSAHPCHRTPWQFVLDSLPSATCTILALIPTYFVMNVADSPCIIIPTSTATMATAYIAASRLLNHRTQKQLLEHIHFHTATPNIN